MFWELPIPEFDRRNPRHQRLVRLAEQAEALAAAATWPEGAHFTLARRAVREALRAAGLQAELDAAALAVLA
jgi:hypothetical protein